MASWGGDDTTHLFSQTDRKASQKCFPGYRLTSLVMKTFKGISLFKDTIVFFQNIISVVVLPHHSKNVLLYHPESSFFGSFL